MTARPRFHPPPLALTAEHRWLLLRAFGPPGTPSPSSPDPDTALRLAFAHQAAARIGARCDPALLAAELGSDAAETLTRTSSVAEVYGAQVLELARLVAAEAAALGAPVAFLKFTALTRGGYCPLGSRTTTDADVLVPREAVGAVWERLVQRGFEAQAGKAPHHLPALAHPDLGKVEVHRAIRGVRCGRSRGAWADFAELERSGRLVALTDHPGRAFAPDRATLLAHALVHGLAQHAHLADSYALLRMVSDLVDLDLLGRSADELDGLAAMIAADVPRHEVDACRELGRALVAGDLAALENGVATDSPPGLLLRHILAEQDDELYRRSIRFSYLQRLLTLPIETSRARFLAEWAARKAREDGGSSGNRPGTRAVRRLLRVVSLPWHAVRIITTRQVARFLMRRGRGRS